MISADPSDVAPPDIPQPYKCFEIIDTMILWLTFSQWTNLAGLRRTKICQLISLYLYKDNMMNYILSLKGMTFQNKISQHQGICGF